MTRERLIIADAGPIIALAAIDRLELMRQLASDVLVPRAVFDEVLAGAPRVGAAELSAATWISVTDAPQDLVDAFALVVDRGEAEALALAKANPGALLVVDDSKARRIAERLELRFTGTLGILDLAKRAGLMACVRPEVERLVAVGFHIEAILVATFLRRVGE